MKIYNPSLLSTDVTGSIRLTNEATASLLGELTGSLDNRYILSGSVSQADWNTLENRPDGILSGSVTIQTSGSSIYSTNPEAGPNFGTVNNIILGDGAGFNTKDSNSQYSNFIGYNAGYDSCDIIASNFIGSSAGYQSKGANSSNFIGEYAGQESEDVNNSNFIGSSAGYQSKGANSSNFIGEYAGQESEDVNNSNFIGTSAGFQVCNSPQSNFIGQNAGIGSINSPQSIFIGLASGEGASETNHALFIGTGAGSNSINTNNSIIMGLDAGSGNLCNSENSIFMGFESARGAINVDHSIFIGRGTGHRTTDSCYSIFMGYNVGRCNESNGSVVGRNNIIIGTNITLPSNRRDSINLGGIIFATGSHFSTTGNPFDETVGNGRVGINVVNPQYALHICGLVYADTYCNLPSGLISSSTQIEGILPSGVVSGSSQIDVTQTTNYASVVNTSTNQTIGGNKTFSNNVIVSGDLSVNGTVNYTSTCNFNVGDNIIELNYGGSATLGGIYVKDVSGTLTSGSLLWNSTTDRWIAGPSGSESNILLANGDGVVSGSSQITLAGDISGTANNTSITTNCIVNDDVNTNAGIIYTKLNLNGSGLVSGSSQVDHNTTTNYVANQHIDHSTVSISPGLGLSGGGTIAATRTLTLDTGSAHFISGSRSALPSGSVSGSSQITSLLPTGTISGSAQVQINSTTGTLCVNKGGTGDTTYTNGQLLIGNTTGNTLTKATLTGTTNQITVTNGAGSITLSTPQNTHTAACVQFGSFGVGTAASGVTGEIRATNEVTAFFSDDRLKTRLGKIEDALNKVKQLNGYYFVENDVAKSLGYTNDNRQVGVSAQEVQSVLPEVVTTAPISDEYLTVRYEKLIPLLIEALKDQNNIVETLINEVEELKNLLNNRG
jgi:hypothetical protein